VTTTQLTATADGNHVLGADATTFSDIHLFPGATPSGATGVPIGACPAYTAAPLTLTTSFMQAALPVAPTEIDQVVSSPDSTVSFITYNAGTASGLLPYYMPSATAAAFGTLGTVQLSSGAQAPIAGIFSPDGSIFFTSTSGDNLVHLVNTQSLTDTQTIDPKLTNGNGVALPAQFLAVKSRSTT
jgi:WD40 repeat protein